MAGLIIDTAMSSSLASQIIAEGLLPQTSAEEVCPPDPRRVQLCLESMLLFGPVLSFHSDKQLPVSRRDLQRLGFFETGHPHPHSLPIWEGSELNPENLQLLIDELRFLKPFVMPFLHRSLKGWLQGGAIEKMFGISHAKLGPAKYRRMVEAIPELVCYNAMDSWEKVDLSRYPQEAVDLVAVTPFIDETFIPMTLLILNEPRKLILESNARNLPILSAVIQQSASTLIRAKLDAKAVIKVVDYAVSRSGFELPRLERVSDLLELMEDDRVISLRMLIRSMVDALKEGDLSVIEKLEKQVQKASHSLRNISRARKLLRLSFLIPMATSIAKGFLGQFPTASTALTLGQVAGDFALTHYEKKHQWRWLLAENHRR